MNGPDVRGLADCIADLHAAVDAQLRGLGSDGQRTAAVLLYELRQQRGRLTDVEQQVERWLADNLPGRRWEADGLLCERHGGWAHTYYVDDLIGRVAERHAVTSSGEVDPEVEKLAHAIASDIALLARLEPRATAIKEYGLDPRDYRESKPSRRTVSVKLAEAEPAAETAP